MNQMRIGTSGYQYDSWSGDFYPADLPKQLWLEYYATRFDSVEINNSFYRLPTAATFAKWRDRTPKDFRFAIKGSQYVSHRLRLKDAQKSIAMLFDRACELGPKLSVVLWQLPENFARDTGRLEQFCQDLASHPLARHVRQAFELRHASWFCDETYALLRHHNHALVINQSSVWPEAWVATADFGYIRFHGPRALYSSGYSPEQLHEYAHRIRALAPDCYAYFNNDAGNFAFNDAAVLRAALAEPA